MAPAFSPKKRNDTNTPFISDGAPAVAPKKGSEFSGYFYSDQSDLNITTQTFYADSGPPEAFRIEALHHA